MSRVPLLTRPAKQRGDGPEHGQRRDEHPAGRPKQVGGPSAAAEAAGNPPRSRGRSR